MSLLLCLVYRGQTLPILQTAGTTSLFHSQDRIRECLIMVLLVVEVGGEAILRTMATIHIATMVPRSNDLSLPIPTEATSLGIAMGAKDRKETAIIRVMKTKRVLESTLRKWTAHEAGQTDLVIPELACRKTDTSLGLLHCRKKVNLLVLLW